MGGGHRFAVSEGIPILGNPAQLASLQDHWPAEKLAPQQLRARIEERQAWYRGDPSFQEFIDLAAGVQGTIVDVGTGPGSSFGGALIPLLGERQRLVMSDVSIDVLRRLKRCWQAVPHRAVLEFVALDMHRLPLAAESVDAFTSSGGFENANVDPRRRRPVGGALAYLAAFRALKTDGRVFEQCRAFDGASRTARYLQRWGHPNASRDSLEAFWRGAGLEIAASWVVKDWVGRADPEDSLPVDAGDRWQEVLYVLRKT
jgi:hypothetical protein